VLDTAGAADLVREPDEPSRVSIEEIARLVGHAPTRTTEVVYRRELRPVITIGAEIVDEIFGATQPAQSGSRWKAARVTHITGTRAHVTLIDDSARDLEAGLEREERAIVSLGCL
jgi:hypothetical protein